MKGDSGNTGINRRKFLGAGGITLLGASMSGILCNIPLQQKNETTKETFQQDGFELQSGVAASGYTYDERSKSLTIKIAKGRSDVTVKTK